MEIAKVARAARAKTAGDEVVGVLEQLGRQRPVALLHRGEGVVGLAQPPHRVGLVGEERRAHQHDPVAVGPDLLVRSHRDRDLHHERVGWQVVVLEEPATDRARADRDHDVVDGAAVLVLHLLHLVQLELAEDEARWGEIRPLNRVFGAL